jgi:DNA-binding NarL/FixJ family response regulator
VRSVLVCVRTPVAAQTIATTAARLGVGSMVRTALSAADALTQLAAEPADLVLADTALSRPDSAEFTRRVLATAPGTVLVLFGPEDPRVAAAAVAAGARGVIRGDTGEPVTVVTKVLLLLLGQREAATARTGPAAAAGNAPLGAVVQRSAAGPRNGPVPAQHGTLPPAGANAGPGAHAPGSNVPQQRSDVPGEPPRRRVDLTERELQVLRGMADGKSNAEIGRELYVSEDTVKTHARRLFRKLGARDRAHAVASAFRAGLVS